MSFLLNALFSHYFKIQNSTESPKTNQQVIL